MRFELEVREPFLDLSVVEYALGLDATALLKTVDGLPRGKQPLRALYDLYPDALPAVIRDRRKIQFDEGAGIASEGAGWPALFEEAISDREFEDGKARIRRLRDRHQGRVLLSARPGPEPGYQPHPAPEEPHPPLCAPGYPRHAGGDEAAKARRTPEPSLGLFGRHPVALVESVPHPAVAVPAAAGWRPWNIRWRAARRNWRARRR